MKTRTKKQRRVPVRRRRLNPLLRMVMIFVLSFSMVQNAFADIFNTATARGTYQSATVTSGTSSASVPVALTAPSIELFKSSILNDPNGDGFAQPGETITYHFPVHNTGNVTLTNIVVSDPSVTVIGGPIASLAPGATNSTALTATYTITAADMTAGQVSNSAAVTAATPGAEPGSAAKRQAVEQGRPDDIAAVAAGGMDGSAAAGLSGADEAVGRAD